MNVHAMSAVLVLLLGAGVSHAQGDRQEPRPSTNASPQRPTEDVVAVTGSTNNVQVALTVSDSDAGGGPQKKVVSVIVADGQMGRVRSARNPMSSALHVDATPRIVNGRIALRLTLEYLPPDNEKGDARARINEFMTVLLENGKPMVISQAADPAMDRKVTVEVTATVLK